MAGAYERNPYYTALKKHAESERAGIVAVPDKRLDVLAKMYHPEKYTPAVIEFVDIAGLVRGASKGEGLGNKFLSNIRECDAIVHVVRCFDDDDIVHVDGGVDPVRDVETINLELIFSDLEIVDRRIDRLAKLVKNDKSLAPEFASLEKVKAGLDGGLCARALIAEGEVAGAYERNPYYTALKKHAESERAGIVAVCAQIEAELSEMEGEEKSLFLSDLGIGESGLDKLVKESYSLLGLISYLTAGPKEVRAWTITKGTRAPQAAGKIHSDFERGFIRAEIVSYDDLIREGSMNAVKEKGLLRSEGKDYVMQDGDVVLFRFNV